MSYQEEAGKGSHARQQRDNAAYAENYDKIFGKQKEKPVKKCYSVNGEDYIFETLEYALLDAEVGSVVYEADAIQHKPSHYFDIDDMIEMMRERAYDDVGECADDFPDISTEKVKELEKLISDFLDSNISVSFYSVENPKEIVVTQEMIDSLL